jgi:hypothetical protein
MPISVFMHQSVFLFFLTFSCCFPLSLFEAAATTVSRSAEEDEEDDVLPRDDGDECFVLLRITHWIGALGFI